MLLWLFYFEVKIFILKFKLKLNLIKYKQGIPLESTDGERLSKCKECKHPALCINPYHIVIHVKELEVYLVNFINNARKLKQTKI